jgi:hypothetical protein
VLLPLYYYQEQQSFSISPLSNFPLHLARPSYIYPSSNILSLTRPHLSKWLEHDLEMGMHLDSYIIDTKQGLPLEIQAIRGI